MATYKPYPVNALVIRIDAYIRHMETRSLATATSPNTRLFF
jgi:hypothetical protein